MKTELIRLDALLLGGMNFYGDPLSTKAGWDSENEILQDGDTITVYADSKKLNDLFCSGQCDS